MSTSDKSQSRNYVFTLFTDPLGIGTELKTKPAKINRIEVLINNSFLPAVKSYPDFKFISFQLEKCPRTGALHLQGYFECLKNMHTKKWIMKKWPLFEKAWMGVREKTRQYAIDYTQKEKTRVSTSFWTAGDDYGQGHRSDVCAHALAIKNGATAENIMDDDPGFYLLHRRNIVDTCLDFLKKRKIGAPPCVIVLHGSSGSGKTTLAKKLAGLNSTNGVYEYMHQYKKDTIWFDGYTGQEDIIFQDFGKGIIPFSLFKVICDNDILVQVKGNTTRILAKRIWITTNDDPLDWYSKKKDNFDRDALYRRIHYCFKFHGTHKKKNVRIVLDVQPNTINQETCPYGLTWLPDRNDDVQFKPKHLNLVMPEYFEIIPESPPAEEEKKSKEEEEPEEIRNNNNEVIGLTKRLEEFTLYEPFNLDSNSNWCPQIDTNNWSQEFNESFIIDEGDNDWRGLMEL